MMERRSDNPCPLRLLWSCLRGLTDLGLVVEPRSTSRKKSTIRSPAGLMGALSDSRGESRGAPMWAKGSFQRKSDLLSPLNPTDHLSKTLQADPLAPPGRLRTNAVDSQMTAGDCSRYTLTNVASDPYSRSASLFLPRRRRAAAATRSAVNPR